MDSPAPVSRADGRVDGRRLRWEEHKRERQAMIVDSAIAVIEDHPPGADVHVQQIADRAGIGRAVVYRHFADRADLDRAVQRRALQLLLDELDPEVVLDGSIEQVILGIVEAYVGWADAHPALHRVGLREGLGQPGSPLRMAVQTVADLIRPLIEAGAEAFGAALDQDDKDAIDLLVFGMVSQVVGAVRLWLSRPERVPGAEALARRMADSVWFQLDGLARARGAVIDPTSTIADVVAAALGKSPEP